MTKTKRTAVRRRDWRAYWAMRDAWTVREFAQLCCGWNPTVYKFPNRARYDEARDSINRAVRVRALSTIDDLAWPATNGETMHDAFPAFRPAQVAAWAVKHYSHAFPFSVEELVAGLTRSTGTPMPDKLVRLLALRDEIPTGSSQKRIAELIAERLVVKPREAAAYAALIRPDEAVAADGRASWRARLSARPRETAN
jgi:hypothetical protein